MPTLKRPKHMDGDPTDKDRARFSAKVRIDAKTGCHVWTAYTDHKGYGQFSWGGVVYWAHRVAYAWHHGKLRCRLEVHHKAICLNPSCVNPEHLETLSKGENSAEANRRTGFRGNQHTEKEAA